MGWRGEQYEARKRRSIAKHNVSVLHDAAQAHLLSLLSAHGLALTEHPIAVSRDGRTHGAEKLWRHGDLFGRAPTFNALRDAGYWTMTIFDIVTASDEGALLTAFEVVAFAPPNARK